MCNSGDCEFELKGLGEHAGQCRKPPFIRCPLDCDLEEKAEDRIERPMSNYGEHLFELCQVVQEVQYGR